MSASPTRLSEPTRVKEAASLSWEKALAISVGRCETLQSHFQTDASLRVGFRGVLAIQHFAELATGEKPTRQRSERIHARRHA